MSTPEDLPSAARENLVDLKAFETRLKILQLAHNPNDTDALVIKRAKTYLRFLKNGEKEDTTPTQLPS